MSRLPLLIPICMSLCFTACVKSAGEQAAAIATPPAGGDDLKALVEHYWSERIPLDGVIAPQTLADARSVEQRYLDAIKALPAQRLDPASRLTYDIFKRARERELEGFTYPDELLPLNPFSGPSLRLATAAADTVKHPLASAADYESWIKRLAEHVRWLNQAAANLRDGARRGFLEPRAITERAVAQFARLGEDSSSNVFYVPVRAMPPTLREPDRTRLSTSLNSMVAHDLLPAFRALHDYLERDYLPQARATVSMAELPLGQSWYAYKVRAAGGWPGAGMAIADIHRLGVTETERIHARLQALQPAAAAGTAPGSASGTGNTAARVENYEALATQVHAALDKVVTAQPKSGFEIRVSDYIRPPGAALFYQGRDTTDHSPAVVYVISGHVANQLAPAAFLAEGEPGQHLQVALAQENAGLPRFRRYGEEPAFSEGWALYATSLGEELGVYTDDAAKIDLLRQQLRCDLALVVDTGLHGLGWTRSQAADYLRTQGGLDEDDAQVLIDAFTVRPAAGLACKLGELRLQALRSRAREVMGARFDLREFNSAVLSGGAMPMDILEARMKTWSGSAP